MAAAAGGRRRRTSQRNPRQQAAACSCPQSSRAGAPRPAQAAPLPRALAGRRARRPPPHARSRAAFVTVETRAAAPRTVPVQCQCSFCPLPTSAFTHRTCALVAASDGATNCASRCLRPPSLQLAGASKAAAVTAGASAAACACMCPMPFAIILVAQCLTPRAQSRLQSRPCCCCQWLLLWRSSLMCVSPVHLWSAPASRACMPAP